MEFFNAHKKMILIGLLIVLIGAGIFYGTGKKPDELKAYGNVDIRQVSLAFNSGERIAELKKEEGDRVKKGEVLAKLNTEPLELSVARLKAQVAMQEATVEKLHTGNRPEEIAQADASARAAEATEYDARKAYERTEALFASGAVSKQQLDDAQMRYETAKASLDTAQEAQNLAHIGARDEDIAIAEAQLKAYRAELKAQEYNLSQATLIAPQDGVVRSRLAEVGDMASPTKPVYLIAVDEHKWVRAYIAETQLGKISEGMDAEVAIDSFPDKKIKGRIGFISDVAEFTPKAVQTEDIRTSLVYEIRVFVEDKDNILRMGMPATVTFPKK